MILNFRKIKQEFSNTIVQKGFNTLEHSRINSVKLDAMEHHTITISCKFNAENTETKTVIEFNKSESSILDSTCSCGALNDCHHLSALIIYLEKNFTNVVSTQIDNEKNADTKVVNNKVVKDVKKLISQTSHINHTSIINEYTESMKLLIQAPIFRKNAKEEDANTDNTCKLIMHILCNWSRGNKSTRSIYVKLSIKTPGKKQTWIQNIEDFQQKCRNYSSISIPQISPKPLEIHQNIFDAPSKCIFNVIKNAMHTSRKRPHIGEIEDSAFGDLINNLKQFSQKISCPNKEESIDILQPIQILQEGSISPLILKKSPVELTCNISQVYIPSSKLFVEPSIQTDDAHFLISKCFILDSEKPLLLVENKCYFFSTEISRVHLQSLKMLEKTAVPEPLFGAFIEQCISVLSDIIKVKGLQKIQQIKTLPLREPPKSKCILTYNEEQEALIAQLYFSYNSCWIPKNPSELTTDHISKFITKHGCLERALHYEDRLEQQVFSAFIFDMERDKYVCRGEKTIVHFMTTTVPSFQSIIEFSISESLESVFVYDKVAINITASKCTNCDIQYDIKMSTKFENYSIKTIQNNHFTMCISKKLSGNKQCLHHKKFIVASSDMSNILILLKHLSVTHLLPFQTVHKPYWSMSYINHINSIQSLPSVSFNISPEISQGYQKMETSKIKDKITPSIRNMKSTVILRSYQSTGIAWMQTLKSMNCNVLLADDMGLGKTVQIIAVLSDYCADYPSSLSIISCPSILMKNWGREFEKFSVIKYAIVTGAPIKRREIIQNAKEQGINVLIVSYASAQKDREALLKYQYDYLVLDEAQYIKNKDTLNHSIAKAIPSKHRIAATGTPIENISTELQNILHFLMHDLFTDAIKLKLMQSPEEYFAAIELIKATIKPFILRRMKSEVLDELPPISEIELYCNLSPIQKVIYQAHSKQVIKELNQRIEKEGLNKSRIHIFQSLTRLKQICCHPGLINKSYIQDPSHSEKYLLLKSVINEIMNSSRRAVIFSQYTSMLNIIKEDLESMNIKFCYIHGGTKMRQEEIDKFDENLSIKLFLISIKSGGIGLNITSADTVIHYDPVWNPFTEKQATDRVHRMGQDKNVFVYKLITSNTIEEKILKQQNIKKKIANDILQTDYETLSSMSWEDIKGLINMDTETQTSPKSPEQCKTIEPSPVS